MSADTFMDWFTEGRPGTMREHVPHTGYFQRALAELARRYGASRDVDDVLARRRALAPHAARAALRQSRLTALLVDTGYPPDGAMSLDDMRTIAPCAIHEIFRVETCAERLIRATPSFKEFRERFRSELAHAVGTCVGFKSIIAYRTGLAVREWTDAEVADCYRNVVLRVERGGTSRLTDKPLLDTLFLLTLETCVASGRPLQVHSGFGDPDIDLLQADPLLLRPIVEDARWFGARIVLLHMSYPYFREAAFMTAVWPQIHLDLSLALPFLGPAAVAPLIEILGLAPASKLLYGSDVSAVPELFALSADWAKAALGEALDWLVARSTLSVERARGTAELILSGNAQRLYGL